MENILFIFSHLYRLQFATKIFHWCSSDSHLPCVLGGTWPIGADWRRVRYPGVTGPRYPACSLLIQAEILNNMAKTKAF